MNKSSRSKSHRSKSKSKSKVKGESEIVKSKNSQSKASDGMGKSLLKSSFDQGKSTVKIEEIRKPSEQIFENYIMDQVKIEVNLNQHKSYVRKEDYFDETVEFSV